MRLVEVVMLMGAHCVSPVEHSQMMTDAAKVQCAVVIEKDTDRGTLTVTPQDAARDPQVAAAIARFGSAPVDGLSGGGTRIVPAWAPAGSPPSEIKLPVAKAPAAPVEPAPAAAPLASSDLDATGTVQKPQVESEVAAAPPPVEQKVATLATPPQKRAAARPVAAPKKAHSARAQKAAATSSVRQCKGPATAKWYTTADGKKKFRCVKPSGDSAPGQLY